MSKTCLTSHASSFCGKMSEMRCIWGADRIDRIDSKSM